MFLCLFLLVSDGATSDVMSDDVASQDHLQVDMPVTVTVNAANSVGQPIYYKFYYSAHYGTDDYATTPWTVVQDYSTSNSAPYTFPSAGNYLIVVRAVTDPNNEPQALSIAGLTVVVGDAGQVSLVEMTVDAPAEANVGETVTVTASASGPEDQTLYYEFNYCANYGTSFYDTTPCTLVQEYSTSNSCQYVFPSAGNYIILVRVATDPNNEPAAVPIVGSAISIGGRE